VANHTIRNSSPDRLNFQITTQGGYNPSVCSFAIARVVAISLDRDLRGVNNPIDDACQEGNIRRRIELTNEISLNSDNKEASFRDGV
jgi:hypothetical protein